MKSRNRTAIAVAPWTATPPILAPLNALDLPRATPTMIPTIQAAEKSQTIIVATHHHISITSFSIAAIKIGTISSLPPTCLIFKLILLKSQYQKFIEDVAMNLLVAGGPQILHRESWIERMKITFRDTGNEMDEEVMAHLSTGIDIDALRAYRLAVGRRTREIVKRLQPEELKQKVDPSRQKQVMDEGAVVEASGWLIDYWGKRNNAGLRLMPATWHNIVHLNEALGIKQRRR